MSEYNRNSTHRHSGSFWESDIHGERSWFAACSTQKKWALCLLLLFVVVWGFFSGYVLSNAMLPDLSENIITGDDVIKNADIVEPTGDEPAVDDPVEVVEDDLLVILLIGCDERDSDIGRSDTMMLAFVDQNAKTVKLLSIPRDTYVQIPASSTKTKINHAYAYGGVSLTRAAIKNVFGIEVDNYMKINFQGFISVVDAIGGIKLDVPIDMHNEDENIHIDKGPDQILDGSDALGFVRYREPVMADIGRVGRQQYFLTELAKQILVPVNITKIPTFISIASKNVSTDLSTSELLALGNMAFDMDISMLETYTLPGDGRYIKNVSYYIADEAASAKLLAGILQKDISEIKLKFPDSSESTEAPTGGVEVVPEDEIPEMQPADPGEQPGEEQPGEEQPGEEQPGEEQPGEEQPGEEQPGEEQPGEEQPGEEQPGEEQPGEEQPDPTPEEVLPPAA